MDDSSIQAISGESWKRTAMLIGGILGALIGVTSAYLFIQNRDNNEMSKVTPREGIKLGILIFALLRGISTLGDGK